MRPLALALLATLALGLSEIEQDGEPFEQALERLKRGRTYAAGVPTGLIQGTRAGSFRYALQVPPSYNPARTYPVRIHLHGGVMRPEQRPLTGMGALAGEEDTIYILPAGWADAPWWARAQVDNLRAILNSVKRTYNVDENRVVLSGVSDGGTGAFYVAMADTTPYASFVSLNGFVMVLHNESKVEGDIFLNNLRAKPWFIANGGRDRLYPTSMVEPYLAHLFKGGVSIAYRPQPEAGHETSWWPKVRGDVDAYLRDHARVPLPDRLSWETSDPSRAGRAHWLMIDQLGATPGDAKHLADLNEVEPPDPKLLFARSRTPGRVDVVARGNHIEAATRGVRRFTLLLSPDQFDFAQPVRVTVNGRVLHDATVQRSVRTLLKWASRDDDRTMLFGAEIAIQVR
jgi:hypothetical protein